MNEPDKSHPPSYSIAGNAQYSDLYNLEKTMKEFDESLAPTGDPYLSLQCLYKLLNELLPIFKKIYSSV